MIHGVRSTYRKGCHCPECTQANTRYTKRLRMDHNAGRHRMLDGTGTVRRLLALACIGWSYSAMGAEMGMTKKAVGWLIRNGSTVTPATDAKVRAMYDRLSMTPGPGDRRVTESARRRGGAVPLAWDDDTIDDPDATPYIGTEHYGASVEDIEWLIRTGGTWESISVRMGITKDAVEQALRRAGRTDLTARLTPEGATNPRGRVA